METSRPISEAQELAQLSPAQRAEVLAGLTDEQAEELNWSWPFWARPNQLEPLGGWTVWLILAGRGFGKTRCGAETVRSWVCGSTPLSPGRYKQIALVAETAADAREVMVGDGKIPGEGSGILQVHPKDFRPLYESSKRRLTWPNGAIATLYNATEPDQLRGPQHDAAWCDESAKWQCAQDTWDQLQFGLRLGTLPRAVVTTTPRPIPIIKQLIERAKKDPNDVVITRGKTSENRANIAPSFLKTIETRYGGTRLGRQELDAEVLDDVPGALWTREILDRAQATRDFKPPRFVRVIVAVDPSGTEGDDGRDDIGIVVAAKGADSRFYVICDLTCSLSPAKWGKRVVEAYDRHDGDRVVAEANFGGAMVEAVIQAAAKDMKHSRVPYKPVVASRGKSVRAEPIAALYEQNRVTHLAGMAALEDECCNFTNGGYVGDSSPNRADALIWALTELSGGMDPLQISPETLRRSAQR